jgi:hypothetical protein
MQSTQIHCVVLLDILMVVTASQMSILCLQHMMIATALPSVIAWSRLTAAFADFYIHH